MKFATLGLGISIPGLWKSLWSAVVLRKLPPVLRGLGGSSPPKSPILNLLLLTPGGSTPVSASLKPADDTSVFVRLSQSLGNVNVVVGVDELTELTFILIPPPPLGSSSSSSSSV